MVRANYHTHSTYCDGKDAPDAIAAYAASAGMTHLGFSGHMDADIHMDLSAYNETICRLQEEYRGKMDILRGIELDTLFDPDCGNDAEYIIGSTHFLDVPSPVPMSVDASPQQLLQLCREFFGDDPYAMVRAYYDLEVQTYDRTHCTFVGHFDLITRFNDDLHLFDEEDHRYQFCALEAMESLVSQGVPFEINCGAVNRGRKQHLYPHPFLLRALREMGGEIVISSDAHEKKLLLGAFDQAAEQAARCGFTHTNILEHAPDGNVTWRSVPLDEFGI